jgi:TPP-dependent pyruvate/acetoin dehydrogenase alpha subunit
LLRKSEAVFLPESNTNCNFTYWMMLISAFEERVSRLHRQNKIVGGVYSGAGQEAIVTRICVPLQDGDFVAPLHCDLGVFLVRGVDPGRLMAQLMGKETGLSRGKDSIHPPIKARRQSNALVTASAGRTRSPRSE